MFALPSHRTFSLDSMTLTEESSPFLTEVTLNLADGSATTRRLPGAVPADFPVVPPSLVGELEQWGRRRLVWVELRTGV